MSSHTYNILYVKYMQELTFKMGLQKKHPFLYTEKKKTIKSDKFHINLSNVFAQIFVFLFCLLFYFMCIYTPILGIIASYIIDFIVVFEVDFRQRLYTHGAGISNVLCL